MRKNIKKIIFLILIFNCYSITAHIDENPIVGTTWLFDFETSKVNINEISKKHYNKMQLVSKKNFEKVYKGRKMIFNTDGIFFQQQSDEEQIAGKWSLSTNKRDITIVNFKGEVLEIRVESVSNSTFVLKQKENQNEKHCCLNGILLKTKIKSYAKTIF